jgi:hypothetical protein
MASWLDLIDDASLDRFVAAGVNDDDDDDIVQVERDAETENLLSPVGSELPVQLSQLYDTELLSRSEISAMNDNDDNEIVTEASEITILPSISSSENLLRDRLFGSHGSVLLVGTDFPSESSSSSVSLSLHPESLDSSVMTDLTEERMISSVSSDEDDSDTSSTASEASRRNHEWEMHGDLPTTTSTSSIHASAGAAEVHSRWYSRFQNEQDWDEFRTAAYQLLQAVDCPEADRDELMAQLIAQEEVMFWDAKESTNRSGSDGGGGGGGPCEMCAEPDKWLVEWAAVVATVAITGVALVRFLKGR